MPAAGAEPDTRALLVDAVGTLLRLREPPAEVYARMARSFGIDAPVERVRAALAQQRIGPPPLEGVRLAEVPARERDGWRAVVRAALGDAAADGPCFAALFAHYGGPEPWALAPGAGQALAQVRAAGVATAVVSNMDHRLEALLERFGVRVDAVVLPATSGLAKPDPRIFALALERLGACAGEAVYVGDREEDCLEAARRAGLRTLRFAPGGDPRDPALLADWSELPRRLGIPQRR